MDEPALSEPLRNEISRLFSRGGRLTPSDCPQLARVITQWLRPEVRVNAEMLGRFLTCLLGQADRRERRARTGDQLESATYRAALRQGVLGFLFLPDVYETSGNPRTPEDEADVRGKDPLLMPHKQEHRQRWAALRQAQFDGRPGEGKRYAPSSLRQYGRISQRQYVDRLVADLAAAMSTSDELVALLADAFAISDLQDDLQDEYMLRSRDPAMIQYNQAPDRTIRSPASAELHVETHEDASVFIADVTLPDGTLVPRGETVTKTWRVRNAGVVPWLGRRLRRLTPQSNTFPTSADLVPIPDTMPGETVDISVDLTTTHVEGTTELRFKMVDAAGHLCFPDRYSYGLVAVITTMGAATARSGVPPPPDV